MKTQTIWALALFLTYLLVVLIMCLILFLGKGQCSTQTINGIPSDTVSSIQSATAGVSVVIHTCERLMRNAEECADRLVSYGISRNSIVLVDGDKDPRVSNDQVYRKNRSFLSTCLTMIENNTPYVIAFEEDSQLWPPDPTHKTRVRSLVETLTWARQHPTDWVLCYLSCVTIQPTQLVRPFQAISARGQLGGHGMMISLAAAKMYVDKVENRQVSFDTWWARQSVKCVIATPPALFQNKKPDTMVSHNIPGTFSGCQDFTHCMWPILWTTIVFLVVGGLGAIVIWQLEKPALQTASGL